MPDIFIAIIPSLLLLISEVLPFVPVKYNGISHALYEILKAIQHSPPLASTGGSGGAATAPTKV